MYSGLCEMGLLLVILSKGTQWAAQEQEPACVGYETTRHVVPPWTHDVILTSLLRQNDVILT